MKRKKITVKVDKARIEERLSLLEAEYAGQQRIREAAAQAIVLKRAANDAVQRANEAWEKLNDTILSVVHKGAVVWTHPSGGSLTVTTDTAGSVAGLARP